MTFEIIGGLIRHALTVVGGIVVTTGYIATSEVEAIVGALMVLIGTAWSVWKKYITKKNADLLKEPADA